MLTLNGWSEMREGEEVVELPEPRRRAHRCHPASRCRVCLLTGVFSVDLRAGAMSRGIFDLVGAGSCPVFRARFLGVRPARCFGRRGGGTVEGGARYNVQEPPRVGHGKLFRVVLCQQNEEYILIGKLTI